MQRESYPKDLTDAQWARVEAAMPPAKDGRTGRPRKYPLRGIWNVIFYQAKNGCTWRALPHDFPPWSAVWMRFRSWRENGTLEAVHAALRGEVRSQAEREPTPSATIVDSQSVRVAEKGGCWGYDAGKKITGRKRHLVIDTLGLIWAVTVQAANVQDRDGAEPLLVSLGEERFPRSTAVFADGGYQGKLEDRAADEQGLELKIMPTITGQSTFVVLPKRWIVERTLAWLMRYRRLRSDFETLTKSSVGWIYTAMIHLVARRLVPA